MQWTNYNVFLLHHFLGGGGGVDEDTLEVYLLQIAFDLHVHTWVWVNL